MILELGKYAFHVLASFAVTLALLGGLTWASVARWRRLRRAVERRERPRG